MIKMNVTMDKSFIIATAELTTATAAFVMTDANDVLNEGAAGHEVNDPARPNGDKNNAILV